MAPQNIQYLISSQQDKFARNRENCTLADPNIFQKDLIEVKMYGKLHKFYKQVMRDMVYMFYKVKTK